MPTMFTFFSIEKNNDTYTAVIVTQEKLPRKCQQVQRNCLSVFLATIAALLVFAMLFSDE